MSFTLEEIAAAVAEVQAESRRCGAGLHLMAVHGRQIWKTLPGGRRVKNGRYCIECKRIKQRTPGAKPRPNAQKPRVGRGPV